MPLVPLWIVEDQQQSPTYNPDGTSGLEWTVYLAHSNGVKSQFTIPDEVYSAANVAKIAQVQSTEIHQVGALHGAEVEVP